MMTMMKAMMIIMAIIIISSSTTLVFLVLIWLAWTVMMVLLCESLDASLLFGAGQLSELGVSTSSTGPT